MSTGGVAAMLDAAGASLRRDVPKRDVHGMRGQIHEDNVNVQVMTKPK